MYFYTLLAPKYMYQKQSSKDPKHQFFSNNFPSGLVTFSMLVPQFLAISCTQLGNALIKLCGVTLGGRINWPLFPLKICATIAPATVSTSMIGGRKLLLASSSGCTSGVRVQLGCTTVVRTLGASWYDFSSCASPSWKASAEAFVQA